MPKLGKCGRCGGNLFLVRDEEGDVWAKCLLCSRTVPIRVRPPMRRVPGRFTYDTDSAFVEAARWTG